MLPNDEREQDRLGLWVMAQALCLWLTVFRFTASFLQDHARWKTSYRTNIEPPTSP